MLMFEVKIRDDDVYVNDLDDYLGKPSGAVDCHAEALVKFQIEPEYRSWGIKGQYCYVTSLAVLIEYEDENGKTVELEIEDFETEVEAKFLEDGQFSINSCEIFLKDKKAILS